jgi:hypothetical protein
MRRVITLTVLAIVAALAITGTASAKAPRVIGSSSSSGDYAVTAVSAESNAKAIYIRGYGRELSALGVVGCSRGIASIGSKSTDLKHMVSGKLYRLKLPLAGDCHITASLSGSGRSSCRYSRSTSARSSRASGSRNRAASPRCARSLDRGAGITGPSVTMRATPACLTCRLGGADHKCLYGRVL